MVSGLALSNKLLISGAGIAGLALARQLKKYHIPYTLIETRKSLTTDGAGIALPANAIHALRFMGLDRKLKEIAHPVHEIVYTNMSNEVLSKASLLEPPFKKDEFVALHRQHLQQMLFDNEKIHYNSSIDSIEKTDTGLKVRFNSPTLKEEIYAGVIGADGVHSRVRELCLPKQPSSTEKQPKQYDDLKLSVFRWISQYPNHNLQPTYMLGRQNVFMAYPISPQEVYCYAHVIDEPSHSPLKNQDARKILLEKFKDFKGVAEKIFKQLPIPTNDQIICNRMLSHPAPMFSLGNLALVGDAAHACTPVLQQGAALAFEDAIVLSEMLHNFPVEQAFKYYADFRIQRVSFIMKASDDPIKNLPSLTPELAIVRDKDIKDNGPFNVRGWKLLFQTDVLKAMALFIEERKRENLLPLNEKPSRILAKL